GLSAGTGTFSGVSGYGVTVTSGVSVGQGVYASFFVGSGAGLSNLPSGATAWTVSGSAIYPSTISYSVGIGTAAPIGFFTVGNSSGMVVNANGHIETFGYTPTVSSCGSSPAGSVVGNDNNGTITIGGGVTTSCTLAFSTAWTNTPACDFTTNSTSAFASITSASPSSVTVGLSATISGGTVYYQCRGYR
ncbi:MAG: hypothetical protein ACYCPQ_08580, partial [Elusimicrobiota bacterium]